MNQIGIRVVESVDRFVDKLYLHKARLFLNTAKKLLDFNFKVYQKMVAVSDEYVALVKERL